MPRFFISKPNSDNVYITGDDAAHICRSLRMRAGERVTLCDGQGTDYMCEIVSAEEKSVLLKIISSIPNVSEPSVRVTLYQGLPKGEKLDTVVQKGTELGIFSFVPTIMERSVSRPDQKSCEKKVARWQKIADQAAKQCERGILPQVGSVKTFEKALEDIRSHKKIIVCYEGGGSSPFDIINKECDDIALIIGPEGGISPEEIQLLKECGAEIITLGTRILRTETAPICALSVIMLLTGNM